MYKVSAAICERHCCEPVGCKVMDESPWNSSRVEIADRAKGFEISYVWGKVIRGYYKDTIIKTNTGSKKYSYNWNETNEN